jgi:predicted lipid-binding transport protein (Tim44 family)
MKFWAFILATTLALAGINAEAAKRLGGGGSVGKQSNNVTQRDASPSAPGGAAQSAAKPSPGAAPAAAPAVAPKKPWGAMLGGLAAGLGLAALAHSLGMGGALGNIVMFGLMALAIMLAVGWFMRRRAQASGQGAVPNGIQNKSPFAFQGAGAGGAPVSEPKPYRPENVGNDASARPWERSNGMPLDAGHQTSGSMIGSALTGSQNWGVPEGFDTEGFLKAAKGNFITLQSAWDKSDINGLRVMMTDSMLKEIQTQLAEREVHTGGPVNHTDVVMLEASLLGIEDLGDDYMASVEFSGMIKEDPSAGPSPFREVWNMTKPKSGRSGWLVAGVQALQ